MTNQSQNPKLTWRKTAFYALLAMFAGMAAGIGFLALHLSLTPALLPYSAAFFSLLSLIPPAGVVTVCLFRRPAGSPLSLVILVVPGILLLCFYLTLIGPALYTGAECRAATLSGLAVHQDCTCLQNEESSTVREPCSFDGIELLPFARKTQGR